MGYPSPLEYIRDIVESYKVIAPIDVLGILKSLGEYWMNSSQLINDLIELFTVERFIPADQRCQQL